jgi:hypothetical protein
MSASAATTPRSTSPKRIRRASAFALAVVLGLAVAPAGGAGRDASVAVSQRTTTIGCADAGTWTESIRRRRPRRCMVFRHNRPDHASQIDLHNIRWRGWGNRRARAKATSVYRGMGQVIRTSVTAVASRRRRARCGGWAYGRLRITFPGPRRYTIYPPRCRAYF